jgi:hypothetical protein
MPGSSTAIRSVSVGSRLGSLLRPGVTDEPPLCPEPIPVAVLPRDARSVPGDLETAHQLIRELLETLTQQLHLNAKLQHQLEQLFRQRYGRKTERLDPGQLLLFAQDILAQAEPEPTPQPDPVPAPAPAPSAPKPKKNGHGRKPLPARLPRKPVVHDVPPNTSRAPTAAPCGSASVPKSVNSSNIFPHR